MQLIVRDVYMYTADHLPVVGDRELRAVSYRCRSSIFRWLAALSRLIIVVRHEISSHRPAGDRLARRPRTCSEDHQLRQLRNEKCRRHILQTGTLVNRVSKSTCNNKIIQEGQNPLTGQRAPPISGGT